MLQKDGDINEDVSYRIKVDWLKRHQTSDALCDPGVSLKLKGKLYRIAIRKVKLYGAECWPTKRRHVQQLYITAMRMLQWICGQTRNHVRNNDIREILRVVLVEEKLCNII
jgi:hypothetical protein